MFSSKIGSYVSFPLEGLDMRPYLHKGKSTYVSKKVILLFCIWCQNHRNSTTALGDGECSFCLSMQQVNKKFICHTSQPQSTKYAFSCRCLKHVQSSAKHSKNTSKISFVEFVYLFMYLENPQFYIIDKKHWKKESRYNMKTVRHKGSALTGSSSENYNLFVIDVLFIVDCKDTVTSYDLVAVICHHGTAGGVLLFMLYLLSTSYSFFV